MPSDDSSPANKRTAGPDSGTVEPESSSTEESVDFGSYVSSTVKSSADLFGTPPRSSSRNRGRRSEADAAPLDLAGGESAPAPDRASRQRAARTPNTVATTDPNRPRTYWRDSVTRDATTVEYDADDRDNLANDGAPNRFGSLFPWAMPGGGRNRAIIVGAVVLAILALAMLIWFLNRGDGDDPPPPTGTAESVINAPGASETPTEAGENASTPSGFIPFEGEETETPESEPEATEPVRRGGDNQLDNDDPVTPGADIQAGQWAGGSRRSLVGVQA